GQQLAALLNLREPTVSHHLAVLRDLALVRMRSDRNTHWYQLNESTLRTISRDALRPAQLTRLAADLGADAWERKVLASFVDGERLTEIPAGRRKRWTILKWLTRDFAPDTSYSEADVNKILSKHHTDCATLRREMIGYRMLQRSRGVYRLMADTEWRRPA
ncbi:MAG: DUF2087 domain-containing protein, partial [Candidatus Binataceae bacterium]